VDLDHGNIFGEETSAIMPLSAFDLPVIGTDVV
jgi:hypothetical protein